MDDARTHLQRLANLLRCQGWSVHLDTERVVLHVANAEVPALRTSIECCDASDHWTYRWQKGSAIGPVSEVVGVADRIEHVLRGVRS